MSTKLKIGIIGAAVLLALLGLFVVFVGMPMAQTRRGARVSPHT